MSLSTEELRASMSFQRHLNMFLSLTDHDLSAESVMAGDDVTTVDDFYCILSYTGRQDQRLPKTSNFKRIP